MYVYVNVFYVCVYIIYFYAYEKKKTYAYVSFKLYFSFTWEVKGFSEYGERK